MNIECQCCHAKHAKFLATAIQNGEVFQIAWCHDCSAFAYGYLEATPTERTYIINTLKEN